MTPRPWEPEAVALRRAERRQRTALLIAGATTAIVVLIAVVAAILADDDDPGVQAGATTQDSTPDGTAVTTASRSTTTARRSTTTSVRSTTTLRPGASSSSGVPSSTPSQGATTIASPTTDAPTSATPSPSRVPPQDDTTTTQSAAVPSSASGPTGTLVNPVPLLTMAPIGEGWNLVVEAYVPDGTETVLAADEFGVPPQKGYQYALASVSATYNGPDASASASDLDIGVEDPSTEQYYMFSCDAFPPGELDTSGDVASGATITGILCFAVPTEEASTVVLYATAGFTNDDVYFALR